MLVCFSLRFANLKELILSRLTSMGLLFQGTVSGGGVPVRSTSPLGERRLTHAGSVQSEECGDAEVGQAAVENVGVSSWPSKPSRELLMAEPSPEAPQSKQLACAKVLQIRIARSLSEIRVYMGCENGDNCVPSLC